MKNKKVLPVLILAFALLLGGAYALYDVLGQGMQAQQMIVHGGGQAAPSSAAQDKPQQSGSGASVQPPKTIPAPDFAVMDENGNAVRLSEYFGKPIVLNFWASWCGPCQYEMPDFNEKYKELGGDVHFVMVNMTDGARETLQTATEFIAKKGYEFPVLFDTKAQAAMTYGAYSLPTTFFIDAQGHVVAQAAGAIDAATLQKGIDMISG